MSASITLGDIFALALRWTPGAARLDGLLASADHWGPAHELGHALASTPDERTRYLYGLPRRSWKQQAAHEVAAMRFSAALLVAAGRPDLVEAERRWTPTLKDTERDGAVGGARRLERVGDVPVTRRGLERLLAEMGL